MSIDRGASQISSGKSVDLQGQAEALEGERTSEEERFADELLNRSKKSSGPGGDADGGTALQRQARHESRSSDSFTPNFSRNLYGAKEGGAGIIHAVDFEGSKASEQTPQRGQSAIRRDAARAASAQIDSRSAEISPGLTQARPGAERSGSSGARLTNVSNLAHAASEPAQISATQGASTKGNASPESTYAVAKSAAQSPASGHDARVQDDAGAARGAEHASNAAARVLDEALAEKERDARAEAKSLASLSRGGAKTVNPGVDGNGNSAVSTVEVERKQPLPSGDGMARQTQTPAHEEGLMSYGMQRESVMSKEALGKTDQMLTYRLKGAGGELLSLQFLRTKGTGTLVEVTTQSAAVAQVLNENARKLSKRNALLTLRAKVKQVGTEPREKGAKPRQRNDWQE